MAEPLELNGTEEYSSGEEEEELPAEPCQCLFCERELESAGATLDHCSQYHCVDLPSLLAQLHCDHLSCIRCINYIRKESALPSIFSPLPGRPYPWDDDSYLRPVLEQDPLLLVDWESETEPATIPANGSEENGMEERVKEYKAALRQALTDLDNMRLAMRQLVGDSAGECEQKPNNKLREREAEEEEEEEEGYFSTYSHYSIHLEMLSDTVRTDMYRDFILQNPALFKDKVVLDVGCGTGILSLFAAQCGAKLVIGVDNSHMVYNAMQIVSENGYEDRITLIRGKLEEVQLPVDKVDIIISEWMGYFLLFESMLDTVIFSRDKWLKDPSHVYPNVCCMKLVAVSDASERETRIDFWDSVYGFKMGCVKREMLKEASVQCVDESSIISSTHTLKEFDVAKVTVRELEFGESFQLIIQHNSLCHVSQCLSLYHCQSPLQAIVGFFEAGFEGPQYSGVLKTGPQSPPTHWKQTVFHLHNPIQVNTGDVLEGRMSVCRSKRDPRALNFSLTLTHSTNLPTKHTPSKPLTFTSKYILR